MDCLVEEEAMAVQKPMTAKLVLLVLAAPAAALEEVVALVALLEGPGLTDSMELTVPMAPEALGVL